MIPEDTLRSIRSNMDGLIGLYAFAIFIASFLIIGGIFFTISLLVGEFASQGMIIASGIMIIIIGTFIDLIFLYSLWESYRKEDMYIKWKKARGYRKDRFILLGWILPPVFLFVFNLTMIIEIFTLISFVMSLMFIFVYVNMKLVQIPIKILEYSGVKVNRIMKKASSIPMVFFFGTMPLIPLLAHYSDGPILDIWSIYVETIYVMVVWISFVSFMVLRGTITKVIDHPRTGSVK